MNKLIVLTLLALTACDDPFEAGSRISDTRVLGVRVEVEGDGQRATPAAGEHATLTLLMAAPSGDVAPGSWALVACLDEVCATPLASAEGHDAVPTLELTVPAREQLGGARGIQVLGVVCTKGEADAQGSCQGQGADGTTLSFALQLADERGENLNPDVQGVRITLAGKPLEQEQTGPCPGLRVKADGKEHELRIELPAQAREQYLASNGQQLREGLQISHFATQGELQRQFSFLEPGEPRQQPQVALSWKLPTAKHVQDGDERVRLWTVVRDLRGGTSLLEHSICLTR